MTTIKSTDETFDTLLKENKILLTDFIELTPSRIPKLIPSKTEYCKAI